MNTASFWYRLQMSMQRWSHRVISAGLRACLRPVYRLKVYGSEWVPPQGPALIVHNAVPWPDVLMLPLSSPRPVRCLVPLVRLRGIWRRVLGRMLGVTFIEQFKGEAALLHAVAEARRALQRGELVAVPADAPYQVGQLRVNLAWWIRQLLSPNGLSSPNTVSASGSSIPIIPVALDRVWGNLFREVRTGLRWKRPIRIPLPLTTIFGSPVSADVPVLELEQRIQQLHCQAFEKRRSQEWSLPRHFVRQACRHPFRVCVVDGMQKQLRLTYAETLAGAMLLRNLLDPLFEREEVKVGLLLPTSVGAVLANLAISLSGRIAVNLNYTAPQEAIASAIQQCQIRHVLSTRRLRERIPWDWAREVSVLYLEDFSEKIPSWQKFFTWLQCVLLPAWLLEWRLGLHGQSSDSLLTIIFSSGTTGEPKGVMLSHFNVLANIQSICQAIEPLPQDRILGVLPLFHSFGYTVTFWLPLVIGASAVFYPDPRQARQIGDLCREHRCTLFVTTPTFLRLVHRSCEPNDFRTVRLLITGAEKLPDSIAQAFAQKFGIWPLEGYGCTELSPVVSTNLPNERFGLWVRIRHKVGTIGRAIPAVVASITDVDNGRSLAPGQMGVLRVRGPNVMLGYLNREALTREAIRDGWYLTNDLAEFDEEGFITIRDRLARFSKIGGEMVPHQRIEEEIQRILNTTELACAVVGVPDERKGEKLVVLHRPWSNGITTQEIVNRLKASGLPNLWLPDAFFEVPELPVLITGKLDLRRLKALALEQVRSQEPSISRAQP